MRTPFHSVLIANRGEIAVRLIAGCRRLGLSTVAVYSDADCDAMHVRLADRAVGLGAAAPSESYLAIDKLIAAARDSGAQAVHPGYGFLAERADFAQAVRDAGLIWIGPDPLAMAVMGDKSAAKRAMRAAGVPCLPGYDGEQQEDAALITAATNVGLPIMVKAAAGGGGRGMRLVTDATALPEALRSARSEARNAFGDGRLLLERVVRPARHIEFQVFGDRHAQLVHLGERECSVQRRHQKIIEEAPSPALHEGLRTRMGAAAVAAARAVEYVGAGTVEFLLAEDGSFYFLEMNTRLQVEHAVTEAVYGVDLVEWQLRVAQGETLPLTQPQIDAQRRGWAIEARLCSEDPRHDHLPQSGPVLAWRARSGPGQRVDTALVSGQQISPHYDSLQAKLIAWGEDREAARQVLLQQLRDMVLLGVPCNRELLIQTLLLPAFIEGRYDTDLLVDARRLPSSPQQPDELSCALAAVLFVCSDGEALAQATGMGRELLGWHSSAPGWIALRLYADDQCMDCSVAVTPVWGGPCWRSFQVQYAQRTLSIELQELEAPDLRFVYQRITRKAHFAREGTRLWLHCEGRTWLFEDLSFAPPKTQEDAGDGCLHAPMTGRVVAVPTTAGADVECGQTLVVLEAMKMELQIKARAAGRVAALHCEPGQQVHARQLLVRIGS